MAGHEPNPGLCACCGWETDELEEVDCYARTAGHGPFTPDDEKQWGWMCLVCRSTFAGNSYQYPTQYRDVAPIMQLIAWGINYLDRPRTR